MATESIALLESLIGDAREKRVEVDEEITGIEERLKILRKKRSDLHDEEVVLTSVLYRQSGGNVTTSHSAAADVPATPSTGTDDADTDWSRVGRSEAVERAVAELTAVKGFATPAEVEELLKQRNRTGDTRDYIGASLAYLRRSHKAHTRARAEWVSGPE